MLLAVLMVLSLLPVAAFADSVPADYQGVWAGTDSEGRAVIISITEEDCYLTIEELIEDDWCSLADISGEEYTFWGMYTLLVDFSQLTVDINNGDDYFEDDIPISRLPDFSID